MQLLVEHGLGVVGQDIHLVPCLLLRSTHDQGRTLMPMPLTYDNARATQKAFFEEAFAVANLSDGPADPEFDKQGHAKRRDGDRTAGGATGTR